MRYEHQDIAESEIPTAAEPVFQHLLDTYVSETNKTASIWRAVPEDLLDRAPHPRATTARGILVHQILSERRFFAQFIGLAEPEANGLLPSGDRPSVLDYVERYVSLARARLPELARGTSTWWLAELPFFGGFRRQRLWTFWRRVLHTCHHRAQVQLHLRVAGLHVPAIYGPSGDVTWAEADPTTTVDAANRGGQQ